MSRNRQERESRHGPPAYWECSQTGRLQGSVTRSFHRCHRAKSSNGVELEGNDGIIRAAKFGLQSQHEADFQLSSIQQEIRFHSTLIHGRKTRADDSIRQSDAEGMGATLMAIIRVPGLWDGPRAESLDRTVGSGCLAGMSRCRLEMAAQRRRALLASDLKWRDSRPAWSFQERGI